MRVFGTLITILVLGIWTATIAHEETSDEDEWQLGIVSAFNSTQDSQDSILLGIKAEDIKNLKPEDCEKNGGPTAHSAATVGWESFLNCTESALNTTELEVDSIVALLSNSWNTLTAKYCGKLPALLQCATNMMDAIKPCLDGEHRQIIEDHRNITSSFLEHVCKNDGNLTASFFSAEGIECVDSKQQELHQACPIEAHLSHVPVSDLLWIKMAALDCTNLDKFTTCTVGVMRTCENPTSAGILESIFEFFKERKSCPSIPPTQGSPAV